MTFKMRQVQVPGYEITLPSYDVRGSVDEVIGTLAMIREDDSCTDEDRRAATTLLKIIKENNGHSKS